ncbi:MAG: hypothetical protein AB1422_18540, partial [bacterium]
SEQDINLPIDTLIERAINLKKRFIQARKTQQSDEIIRTILESDVVVRIFNSFIHPDLQKESECVLNNIDNFLLIQPLRLLISLAKTLYQKAFLYWDKTKNSLSLGV